MENFIYLFFFFFFAFGWKRTNGVKFIPPCSLRKFASLTCSARRGISKFCNKKCCYPFSGFKWFFGFRWRFRASSDRRGLAQNGSQQIPTTQKNFNVKVAATKTLNTHDFYLFIFALCFYFIPTNTLSNALRASEIPESFAYLLCILSPNHF